MATSFRNRNIDERKDAKVTAVSRAVKLFGASHHYISQTPATFPV